MSAHAKSRRANYARKWEVRLKSTDGAWILYDSQNKVSWENATFAAFGGPTRAKVIPEPDLQNAFRETLQTRKLVAGLLNLRLGGSEVTVLHVTQAVRFGYALMKVKPLHLSSAP